MNRRFQHRCIALCLILVAGLSLLSVRLVHIQLEDRHYYAKRSHDAFYRKETLRALPGMIVDRNEEPLAKSIPVSTLVVDKTHIMDPDLVSFSLAWHQAAATPGWEALAPEKRQRRVNSLRAEILDTETPAAIVDKHLAQAVAVLAKPLGLSREELRKRIENSKGSWVPVTKDIPGDLADQLRELIDNNWLLGFNFENTLKRWYFSPTLAAHIVGFRGEKEETGENGVKEYKVVGKFGVERAMDRVLTGRDGWREHRRDTHGLVVPGDATSLLPPRAGLNVRLTIDMGMQAIVEEEIDAGLKEYVAHRGAVVVMDPKTGEVLAMVSRPNFDLNLRDNLDVASSNFAIQAVYEPGSTYKVVATSGVLNEGLATPYTSVFCHNGKMVCGSFDVPDHDPYGMLTLEGVLAKSSNIGAYKFALQLGNKRFYDYVGRYGFGNKTGIQLSGERGGVARNTGNPVDFSRASYGYALNVTPLQMACAYSVLAYDGRLRKPHIVRSVIANDGTVIENFQPEVVREVVKPRVAKQMRTALEKVVEKGGTATSAAVPGFQVSGKTGTAKRINPKGPGYLAGSYTVSFVGMMPAKDPAFVCIVVVDDPRTNKVKPYGGTIAAPIFSKIATRLAARMNLTPTESICEKALAADP